MDGCEFQWLNPPMTRKTTTPVSECQYLPPSIRQNDSLLAAFTATWKKRSNILQISLSKQTRIGRTAPSVRHCALLIVGVLLGKNNTLGPTGRMSSAVIVEKGWTSWLEGEVQYDHRLLMSTVEFYSFLYSSSKLSEAQIHRNGRHGDVQISL